MNQEHHMMSGHNSQWRQQEDLVAVLVYVIVSAEAQGRLQATQILDALKTDDAVDTQKQS